MPQFTLVSRQSWRELEPSALVLWRGRGQLLRQLNSDTPEFRPALQQGLSRMENGLEPPKMGSLSKGGRIWGL